MQLAAFNLRNKLAQTPLSPAKCLVPLFEAIANSFNAIQEAKQRDGTITVSIIRDKRQASLRSTSEGNGDRIPSAEAVDSFVIEDNGIGFTDENLASFTEAYTDRKLSAGGKGIGRILWLKAFARARVDSIYADSAKHFQRKFTFALGDETVPTKTSVSGQARRTIVTLENYLPDYKYKCPAGFDTIARRIIAHFVEEFALDTCPTIVLKDDDNIVTLNRYFKTSLRLESHTKAFKVGAHRFTIAHICLAALPETTHEVHLCAGSPTRSVTTRPLSDTIPLLSTTLLHSTGKPFVYAAYVTGKALEDDLDEFRSRIDIPEDGTLFASPGKLTWQQLTKAITDEANSYLKPYLQPLRKKNVARIKSYICDTEPKYRPLAKHRAQWLDLIPPNLSDAELSIALYKLWKDFDQELLAQRPRVSAAQQKTASSIETRKRRLNKFLMEWNDQGMSKLADYVLHRKATLEFFRESLKLLSTDRYAAESQIHRIICPMRATSDDVPLEQMNLWIIDERLTYHSYLASDKPMRSLEPLASDSDERADLILFNCALAFSDREFSSVVIIEFKRPMRKEYSDRENPIKQVYDYVDALQEGRPVDLHGRPMPSLRGKPIYAYIVCDITPQLKKQLRVNHFFGSADEETYYSYNSDYRVYIEVISFNRLLADAERRNSIFFDKLNLQLGASRRG
jgi:hypothetical protein